MMIEENSNDRRGNKEGNQLPDRLLTVREVADLLHVHTNTVRGWSDLGLIKSYRVGPRGDRRFKAKDINNFITTIGPNLGGAALIVDDDIGMRQLMEDAVVGEGYEVVAVASGERALEELEKQHFDLIFLDLVLPGLSGVDVLRAIKERNQRTLVAVITGYGDDPIAMEAMSLGPLFFIRKPFKMSDITEVLDAVMRPRS
jgi:excisionase family DNA binding protein